MKKVNIGSYVVLSLCALFLLIQLFMCIYEEQSFSFSISVGVFICGVAMIVNILNKKNDK